MIFIVRRVAIASAIALAAILMWFRRVDAPKVTGRMATVPVIVAGRDVPEGVLIDRMAVVVAQWPVGTSPAGAYRTVDSVIGRVSRVQIFKGEAIVPGRLAPAGTGPGLEVRITPGKRAYGVRIDDGGIAAGMIQPNSRVDIMVVIDDPGTSKRTAKLFMSNMRVLAIGVARERAADGRPTNPTVATIEVTPEEAEHLAFATTQGSIQLVLRGYGERHSIELGSSAPMPNGVSPNLRRGMPIYVPPPPGVAIGRDTIAVRVFRGRSFSNPRSSRDSAARLPRPESDLLFG